MTPENIQLTENKTKIQRPKTLLLIDAYNLIYRAYHASLIDAVKDEEFSENQLVDGVEQLVTGTRKVKTRVSPTTTREGVANNAVYSIALMLKKILKKFPDVGYCLAVFDGSSDNFRKDLDPNYKANRPKMPDDLIAQMPNIKRVFDLLGFPTSMPEGVEADDVIGALSKRAENAGFKVDIISMDKDFRQVVSENVLVHDTMHDIVYDRKMVIEKDGVPPESIIDYLSLIGDGADNVKGINKCGPKTAIKLINEYANLDGIIANAHKVKGVVGENLRSAIQDGSLELYRKLVTIKLDVDVIYKNSEMTMKEVDKILFDNFCQEVSLYKLQYFKPTLDDLNIYKQRDKEHLENFLKRPTVIVSVLEINESIVVPARPSFRR